MPEKEVEVSGSTDADLEFGAGALELFAPLIGFVIGGPVGLLGGAVVAGMGQGARHVATRRLVRRVNGLEEVVRRLAAERYPELLTSISTTERSARLAQLALEGAFSTGTDEQVTASGDLLVAGVLGNDQAASEAEFAMRVVAGLTGAEIATLITRTNVQPEGQMTGMTNELAAELEPSVSTQMIRSVMRTLDGKGLMVADPPGFGGYLITPFGRRVANALQE
jgi:hypothetical protein